AVTRPRPGARTGSVVPSARPPAVSSTLAAGPDPTAQAPLAVYAALHRLARLPPDRVPPLDDAQADVLRTAFGTLPDAAANDGMVPTRSQPWGEVIAAVQADHLDVVGHFGDPAHDPPHIDWITTGSGFTAERFEALLVAAADFMLAAPASGIPESRSAAS